MCVDRGLKVDLFGFVQEEVVGEGSLESGVPARPLLSQPVELVKQVLQSLLHVTRTHHKLGRNTEDREERA